jgi:K+-transporting ATPase ATPase A chain
LYASAFANNGQSMAGLSANNIFYNTTTIIAMLAGRYIVAVLALSFAGRFAAMSRRPPSSGTMPSDGFVFGVLLTGTTLLVGALNFLPALAMGESSNISPCIPNILAKNECDSIKKRSGNSPTKLF